MKKTILAALLIAACGSVSAVEWDRIDSNSKLVTYASKDHIWREGSIISMWQLLDFPSPLTAETKSIKSVKLYVLMNCKNMTTASWHFLTMYDGHMGYGNVIESVNESPQWEPVIPGTLNDEIMQTMCKK